MHVLCSILQLLLRGSGTRYEVDLLLDSQQAVQIVEHAARNRPDRAVGIDLLELRHLQAPQPMPF